MTRSQPDAVQISRDEAAADGRYHRQELIPWWDQARLASARVLVIGAGALGNEILKGLALAGVGEVQVWDMDLVERSNLNRSVLFRPEDEGAPKVDAAARRMAQLNADIRVSPRQGHILHALGLGVVGWADVVICGLDNREARVFINAACSLWDKVWVDGAIEALDGIVRVFRPARGACYECTMNATDRQTLAERRSCAMLARDVVARGHVPSTAVAASIVGALEVQEALKVLHGKPTLEGEGLHIMGMWSDFSRIRYPRREACPGHDHLPRFAALGAGVGEVTLGALLDRAERDLGEGASLDLSRDVVTWLECFSCGTRDFVGAVLGALDEAAAACPTCGEHRAVDFTCTVDRGADFDLAMTPAQLGLPPLDVIVARRGLEERVGWVFDGDAPSVMAPLTPEVLR